ncbi:MAG: hypothetical protein ABI267_07730 [Ginsengibacter sp.]
MNKFKTLLFLIAATTLYSSCNKHNDLQNPDPVTIDSVNIMGFKDSTLLIKSLHRIDFNGDGTFEDSSMSYISYDTLNRKITITDGKGSETGEYAYNTKGLLIHILEKDDNGTSTTDYTSDESNILKSVTENGVPGGGEIYTLNKTLLPSGNYQLSWESPSDILSPNTHENFLANFDSKGSTLSYYDYTNDELSLSDSILYDAGGNISKVIRTRSNASRPFTQFDFISRDTKGDQLYNFYSILYNGVANFSDLYSGFSGIFNQSFFQFFKYPALSTDITNADGDSFKTISFNDTPQYDSKNRLIKFREFFNDVELYVTEYTIGYYK